MAPNNSSVSKLTFVHRHDAATCNSLHEMGLEPSLQDNTLRLLSTSGSWRDAWTYKAPVARPPNETPVTDNVIMKTIK